MEVEHRGFFDEDENIDGQAGSDYHYKVKNGPPGKDEATSAKLPGEKLVIE